MEQAFALADRLFERQVFQPIERVVVDEGAHGPEKGNGLPGHMDHGANVQASSECKLHSPPPVRYRPTTTKRPSTPVKASVGVRPMSALGAVRSTPKMKPCNSFVAAQPQTSQVASPASAPVQSSACSTRSRAKKPGKGGVATAASTVNASTTDRRGRGPMRLPYSPAYAAPSRRVSGWTSSAITAGGRLNQKANRCSSAVAAPAAASAQVS